MARVLLGHSAINPGRPGRGTPGLPAPGQARVRITVAGCTDSKLDSDQVV